MTYMTYIARITKPPRASERYKAAGVLDLPLFRSLYLPSTRQRRPLPYLPGFLTLVT